MPQTANQPRVAQVHLTDPTFTNSRGFIATAAVEETSQGSSGTIEIIQTSAGLTPPEQPDVLELSIRVDDDATQVILFTLNPALATQTVTFHFTDTGTAGGAARHGTLRLRLRAARTTGTAAQNYDINSDTGATVANPTFTNVDWNKGWIIGTTAKTHQLSNVAAGGAKAVPAEYDESLFLRVVLGSQSYKAHALSIALSAGGVSGSTNSSTSATRDATFSNVVDDRFPAALTTVTATVTAPNATLSGKAYTTFTSTTPDSIDVDPRLNAISHLFQRDDDVIGTPPMSKHDSTKSALVSSYSAVAFRIVTARTQSGVNGLSYAIARDPQSPGATLTSSGTTATRGGEAGWTDLAQVGPFVIGGTWDVSIDIIAPADIDNNAHLLNSTDQVFILSPDPRIMLQGAGGGARGDDWKAGDPFTVGISAAKWELSNALPVLPDSDGAGGFKAYGVVSRQQDTGANAGLTEVLQADGVTWTPIDALTDVIYAHQLTRSRADSFAFVKTFNSTSGWGDHKIGVTPIMVIGGTPYAPRSGGLFSTHTHPQEQAFDAVAFAVPGVSFK